jgi:hypothetical protein
MPKLVVDLLAQTNAGGEGENPEARAQRATTDERLLIHESHFAV